VDDRPEPRPFRFGYQHRGPDVAALRDAALRAEAAGFDVFHVPDHVTPRLLSPLAALQAAAEATTSLRVCPLVLNNDFHHPVHLATEVASLDRLSGGRVELGIGAGHSFTEYEAIGLAFDPAPVRKARMAEAVGVLRRLLDGEVVDHDGDHHRLRGVEVVPPQQEHVPILVGVGGRTALARAAARADTIGLTMLGRTLPDGQSHEVRWEADRLDGVVAGIVEAARAAGRARSPELNVLVQVVKVTDDREAATRALLADLGGLSLEDALASPFLAIGTATEVADHLRRCRDRWGITYISVRDIDAFAPVIEILRSHP
jgi:probable F420-dependent oxidoreductase